MSKAKGNQYLFHLCFDWAGKFRKNMYFNYEAVDFKLIKGTKQYQDALYSIIDIEHSSGKEFNKRVWKVWEIALRFLSCLSWELNIGIERGFCGGCSWRKEFGGLLRVTKKTSPLTPQKTRYHVYNRIVKLPRIDNEYKAHALSLFREAMASNSLYYKFLCYWKILEIYPKKEKHITGKAKKQINWINKTIRENKWILTEAHFEEKLLGSKSLGDYLNGECRNAVAHVMPKYKIKLDSGESLMKVNTANWIMRWLVDIFMKKELELAYGTKNNENYLFLKKKKGRRIPVFEAGLKFGDGHLKS